MKNISTIAKCPLFAGVSEQDVESLLTCLSGRRQTYKKGGFILNVGESPEALGVLLSGRALILKEDFWGNRTILSEIEPPDIFAETFSCAGENALPVSVMATEECDVLFLDCRRVVTSCTSACGFHTSLIRNMLQVMARKNLALVDKIEHITKRTTREKLLSYLSEQARLKDSHVFEIPYNRQELADYLAVERSGMSFELSKMRDAGILKYRKNRFELLAGG